MFNFKQFGLLYQLYLYTICIDIAWKCIEIFCVRSSSNVQLLIFILRNRKSKVLIKMPEKSLTYQKSDRKWWAVLQSTPQTRCSSRLPFLCSRFFPFRSCSSPPFPVFCPLHSVSPARLFSCELYHLKLTILCLKRLVYFKEFFDGTGNLEIRKKKWMIEDRISSTFTLKNLLPVPLAVAIESTVLLLLENDDNTWSWAILYFKGNIGLEEHSCYIFGSRT